MKSIKDMNYKEIMSLIISSGEPDSSKYIQELRKEIKEREKRQVMANKN